MLERAKALLQPSARSGVPPFMVMDVMAAAARLEAQGRTIVHMEVGQPAAGAPASAIAAVRAALGDGPHGYTATLGIAPLRQRIAQSYAQWRGLEVDPERVVVTTGSSAAFMLAFLALFEAGDRVAVPIPGYPPYRHILSALGCEPVLDRNQRGHALGAHRRSAACATSRPSSQRRGGRFSGQSDWNDDERGGARRTHPIRRGRRDCRDLRRNLPRTRLCFPGSQRDSLSANTIVVNSFSKYFCMTGWRVGWMVVPPSLLRTVERLQQNLAISVPTLSQIAAQAAFDGRDELENVKHGYEENRRILLDGLPRAGLDSFLPVDGAFYLYVDTSRFSDDSFDFAKRMLEQAGVAATPGVDFDPIHGRNFLRLCYAGSREDMREAVKRIGAWLKG